MCSRLDMTSMRTVLVQLLYDWVKRNVLENYFDKYYGDKENMMTVIMQMTVNKSR